MARIEESSALRLKLVERRGMITHVVFLLLSMFFPRMAKVSLEEHLTFDGRKRQVLIERWSLTGKMEDEIIAFSDIAAIDEEEYADGGPGPVPGGGLWRMAITMRDGRRANPYAYAEKQVNVAAVAAARRLLALDRAA